MDRQKLRAWLKKNNPVIVIILYILASAIFFAGFLMACFLSNWEVSVPLMIVGAISSFLVFRYCNKTYFNDDRDAQDLSSNDRESTSQRRRAEPIEHAEIAPEPQESEESPSCSTEPSRPGNSPCQPRNNNPPSPPTENEDSARATNTENSSNLRESESSTPSSAREEARPHSPGKFGGENSSSGISSPLSIELYSNSALEKDSESKENTTTVCEKVSGATDESSTPRLEQVSEKLLNVCPHFSEKLPNVCPSCSEKLPNVCSSCSEKLPNVCPHSCENRTKEATE